MKNKIKEYREKFKLSKKDLALKSGLEEGIIDDLENNKLIVSLADMFKIAKVFNVSLQDLFVVDE